jgi:DNA helicase-2/ATP-dependent DNA helicase PcrA
MYQPVSYEKHLNASQLEAVFHTGSPLLVLAGAGSGKTRVITYKIAYLINECGYNPQNLLAVTFTNKASNEMRERVNLLLGAACDVWIKTFHSTAAKLLRTFGRMLNVDTGFTILDEGDQLDLIRKIMKDLRLDPDTYSPGKYVYLINRAKDMLLDAQGARAEGFSTDQNFYDIFDAYEQVLQKDNLLDFGDLISKLVRGLNSNPETLDLLKRKFRYILIDEFQDTNYAQYALVKLLALPEGNICVVGDDDQSIYGFRGARVENVISYTKDFVNTRIIKLEENYRSYQSILTASSRLIDHNTERLGKTLYTNKGTGEKLIFYLTPSDYDEARCIAQIIQQLVFEGEYSYSDMAVFYRMNAQSRVFESVFSQSHIPYVVVGGLRFYEREEIKDILSYIRLIANPMDEVALRRIANKPPRGLGKKTIEALISSTLSRGRPFFEPSEDFSLPPNRAKNLKAFFDLFKSLKDELLSTRPADLLRKLYDVTGYLEWLLGENQVERVKNLEELYNAVEEFSKTNSGATIVDFIQDVSLDLGAREEEFGQNRVHLITLHNAKGLEFPVVFMAGMEEGIFPHYLSGERLADLQEERRLCYVGMTRAMDRLFFTAARARKLYGRTVEREISKFISEIPSELLEFRDYSYPLSQKTYFRPVKAEVAKNILEEISVNTRVIHPKFGRGVVLSVEKGVAEISFDNGMVMKFMLQYTPISIE